MSGIKDCPFCDPGQRILKSNDSAYILLSNPRLMPGHFLTIPKRHVEDPRKLTGEELKDIFELIFFVENKILGKLGTGCDIRQNYRPFLKQGRVKIDHVHFHIMPRSFEDELYKMVMKHETDMFKDLAKGEHDKIAALLEE
jgi:diadenosine tetraphosphate (Ap4A) HIT family hydrolase